MTDYTDELCIIDKHNRTSTFACLITDMTDAWITYIIPGTTSVRYIVPTHRVISIVQSREK